MGKKRIIKNTEEQLLKEKEVIESRVQKDTVSTRAETALRNGRLYVASSYNNTIITLTDEQGNVLAWSSSGKIGFKGTKKGTPYAANRVAEVIAQAIEKLRLDKIKVKVKGIGSGRESAIRTLVAHGVHIVSIEDVTPVPHNGCKPPKPRRV